ncbi:MAG: NAD(P)/FAD-dependent oxidoreductase [Candidatus Saccharimonadales bacterium]
MARKQQFDYDLIVIGTGAGGSAAATIAAKDGRRVAVVEADVFGGDSPNWSDIPTKALLHAAQLYDEAKQGARFGLRSSTMSYNYPSLRTWKELAIKRTGAGGNRRYYEQQGISTFQGTAHFLSPHEISINRRHVSAAQFLIATGSQWVAPDIQGIHETPYLTPRTLLEALKPPKSLYIIGGGTVGIELAQLMAIFGTKVYIADIAARLLPSYDSEVGEGIEKLLHDRYGITTLTHTRTLAVERENIARRVTYNRGGVERSLRVDEIMIATGRCPAVDLGLENAGVTYTAKGIEVDNHLQTAAKHIYAAGDVLGKYSVTHTALLESRIAVHNMFTKNKLSPDYTAMPRIVFTYPGVASVGLTEDDCLKRDLDIRKGIAPLSIIARSNTSDFRDGFVKIITNKKGVLLGATIMAPHAGEMIHELALALKHGMTAHDIAATPHAFLSWSEAIRVAASRVA